MRNSEKRIETGEEKPRCKVRNENITAGSLIQASTTASGRNLHFLRPADFHRNLNLEPAACLLKFQRNSRSREMAVSFSCQRTGEERLDRHRTSEFPRHRFASPLPGSRILEWRPSSRKTQTESWGFCELQAQDQACEGSEAPTERERERCRPHRADSWSALELHQSETLGWRILTDNLCKSAATPSWLKIPGKATSDVRSPGTGRVLTKLIVPSLLN